MNNNSMQNNLEDNLQDIITKACTIKDVDLEKVAEESGLNYDELSSLLVEGNLKSEANYKAIGRILGLSPAKLKNIAEGWHPEPINLDYWNAKQFLTINLFPVNCYLLWDDKSHEAAMFDTGFDARESIPFILKKELRLKYVFITHTHIDHCNAAREFRSKFPMAICINAPDGIKIRNGMEFALGSLRIKVIHIPTHSVDSFAYLVEGFPDNLPPVVFTGDIIFAGSIGKISYAEGKFYLPMIKDRILSLPLKTVICPGHGPLTTVEEELKNNPFF